MQTDGRVSRSIPAVVRAAVIARDGMVCQRCWTPVVRAKRGEPYRPEFLHLDHIKPWSEGGEHELMNLIVCCASCNLRRAKPKDIIRSTRIERIAPLYRSGTYYWPEGYSPPRVADDRRALVSLRTLVRDWRAPLSELVLPITRGDQAATGGEGPIHVDLYLTPIRTRRRPSPSGMAGRHP